MKIVTHKLHVASIPFSSTRSSCYRTQKTQLISINRSLTAVKPRKSKINKILVRSIRLNTPRVYLKLLHSPWYPYRWNTTEDFTEEFTQEANIKEKTTQNNAGKKRWFVE